MLHTAAEDNWFRP